MKRILTMALFCGVAVLSGAAGAWEPRITWPPVTWDELPKELGRCRGGIESFNEHEDFLLAALNDEVRPVVQCAHVQGLMFHYEGLRYWIGQRCYELASELVPDLVGRVALAELVCWRTNRLKNIQMVA